MKVIAVDFDGCLCEEKWPDIGEPRQRVIDALLLQQKMGAKLILWTCREGHMLLAAVMWCLNHGLKFDAINDNLEENKQKYGNNCRKVWADEYWDDKSVLVIGTGEGTSIAYPGAHGGVTMHTWRDTSGDTDCATPQPQASGRKKRWWQRSCCN